MCKLVILLDLGWSNVTHLAFGEQLHVETLKGS